MPLIATVPREWDEGAYDDWLWDVKEGISLPDIVGGSDVPRVGDQSPTGAIEHPPLVTRGGRVQPRRS